MEDWRDVESYLRGGLIYPKEDHRPPLVIVTIIPFYRDTDSEWYKFRVDNSTITISEHDKLYETMQRLKKAFNEKGKVVLFA